ncbi:MAG: glycine cleavage system protein H [bacterium]
MAIIEGYNLPDDLYYHFEHSWAKIENDGNVKVGMNDMFQKTSGDIVYVDMPFEGDVISQGEVCGKIQSSKWIGKLIAPVSGEIIAINEELEKNSTIINKSPYDQGWIMLIKPSNLEEELKNLMKGESVIEWMKKEIKKSEEKKKKPEGTRE